MINWVYFPQTDKPTDLVKKVISVFEKNSENIDSLINVKQVSNEVLKKVRGDLENIGFLVEKGLKKVDKINVPVLFGRNGKIKKYFEADAFHKENGFVIEVEAGRAYTNNQFLKDLFQACMMNDVDYLAIAVRNDYRGRNDFEKIFSFFDTLYKSNRLNLPLKGLLLIGY